MKRLIPYFAGLLVLYSPTSRATPINCLEQGLAHEINFGRAAFSPISPDTDIETLSEIYTHLSAVTNKKLIKNLEARRLIDPKDWKNVQSHQEAWRIYGDKTMQDWFEGRKYILSLPQEQALDSRLLKKIHKIVTRNHKFHGFEGRRILQQLREGKISRKEFDELKRRAFEKNEEISGVPHSSLTGVFRHHPIDQVIHKGSSFKKDGSRYFTQKELDAFKNNKYITVDKKSIKPIGKNAYTGTALYQDVGKVEESVKHILKVHAEKLDKAKKPKDIVRIVASMEKDLISVHPFLDGNGRTIRLLGDYILNKYNLPPSLYPNEADLVMSIDEAVSFRIKGMRDYLKEHQKQIREIKKNTSQ